MRLFTILKNNASRVLDWVYPRICPECGKLCDREARHLCWDCFQRIELYRDGLCEKCGQPTEGVVHHAFLCGACRKHPYAFDRARATAVYQGVLSNQLQAFKYNQALWLKDDLVDLLEGGVRAHYDSEAIDLIVPVPLHFLRLHKRTYNQAAILAQALAQRLDRSCDVQSLIRTHQTATQTRFHAQQRQQNVKGAFRVVRPAWICQRNILLIDDVMTTGATVGECSRVLKAAGANKVVVLTVARGK